MHSRTRRPGRSRARREGITLLLGVVLLMWVVEVINTIDSNGLDGDGIYGRRVSHLWGILTAPFIHASFAHLIGNTIPFVFMGLIIALRGAARLAAVTLIVILVGGFGTWLVAPANVPTIGASGVVFGYAAYLFARGFFNRSIREVLVGLVVGVIWGGALLASLVPHHGISWQGHLFGLVGGVVAASLLRRDRRPGGRAVPGTPPRAQALAK
ncbi:MAG TPA: rhomboid family intramembrane serine protease [Solirubrobacteraceae bacterium]|nr:rhomboid family intramembrane serine protease [Solirubrobacteraceae bacterium]